MPGTAEKARFFGSVWEPTESNSFNPLYVARSVVSQVFGALGRHRPTMIVSIGGTHAHFFVRRRFHRLASMGFCISMPEVVEEPSRPEHSTRVSLSHSNASQQAKVLEQQTLLSEVQLRFVLNIARFLHLAWLRGHFQRLVIVAEPCRVTALKDVLSSSLCDLIVLELDHQTECDPIAVQNQVNQILKA